MRTGDMKARNGWLFPLMVLAAGSVTVFGCIGIAAITGYLPLAKVSPVPLGPPQIAREIEVTRSLSTAKPAADAVVVSNTGRPDSATLASESQADKLQPARKKASQ
jgi:hypothetical protein